MGRKKKGRKQGKVVPIVYLLWAVAQLQRYGLFAAAGELKAQVASGGITNWDAVIATATQEAGDLGNWVATATEGFIFRMARKFIGRVPIIKIGGYRLTLL